MVADCMNLFLYLPVADNITNLNHCNMIYVSLSKAFAIDFKDHTDGRIQGRKDGYRGGRTDGQNNQKTNE